MPSRNNCFAYFEEETLTYPNAEICVFYYRHDIPIAINMAEKDLELFFDWEDETECKKILKGLITLGLFDLDVGVTFETLFESIVGKQVLLSRDLAPLCTINLQVLNPKSTIIPYSDLRLTSYKHPISLLIEDFPEFLLDFGEALEEKLTLCWIGNMGVLRSPYCDTIYIQDNLEQLCANYMILENMHHVIDKFFESDALEKSFSEYVSAVSRKLLDPKIDSFRIVDAGDEGKTEFLSLVRSRAQKMPFHSKDSQINEIYNEFTFSQNNVSKNFEVHLKVFSELGVNENRLREGFNLKCDTVVYKGATLLGRVKWGCYNNRFLEKIDDYNYIYHFTLTPWFGSF